MNITIEYKAEDYIADLRKTAEIKIGILYKNTPLLDATAAFVVLLFLATGVKTESIGHYLVGTILVIIAVVILISYVASSIIMNSKRKSLRNLANKDRADLASFKIFTITETMFAIRTKETYREHSWNDYASYLITDEFVFFVNKGDEAFHYALFVNKKKMSKEQYEELITFLASKLPILKI